jgi:omega-amidase
VRLPTVVSKRAALIIFSLFGKSKTLSGKPLTLGVSLLKTAIVQYAIHWKNKAANFRKVQEMLGPIDADLIVLPEMFQTGFCIDDASLAEGENGETTQFLARTSKEKSAAIAGSFLFTDGEKIYNRLAMFKDGNLVGYYDKVHLFNYGNEGELISSGGVKADFVLNGFKIRPIICYDLRFPYSCFNDSEYDILLCSANWPSARIHHWDALLEARAIENQAYVVACNRVGEQPLGEDKAIYYPGHSSVYHPDGSELGKSHKEEVLEVAMSKAAIEQTRTKLPFLKDRKM